MFQTVLVYISSEIALFHAHLNIKSHNMSLTVVFLFQNFINIFLNFRHLKQFCAFFQVSFVMFDLS